MFPAIGYGQQSPASGFAPAVAHAFTAGNIYAFAVMRNGAGYCLPPDDKGLDVIWKTVSEDPNLFKDVKFEPNRLPEDVYLKLLWRLFPCQ